MSEIEKEIELYLSGNMTPEQQLNFEKKMNSDLQLKQDVATYHEMQSFYDPQDWNTIDPKKQHNQIEAYETFLKSEKGQGIASSIKSAENQHFQEKTPSGIKKWIWYGSSIAAILVIGFFIIFQITKTTDSIDLYAEYKNWEDLPSLTQRDENTQLSKAEGFFRKEQYSEALSEFRNYKVEHTDELNPQVLIYIGIAELELDQNKSAENTFTKLLNSNTLDAPKAHWYLALTYLKMNDRNKTMQELDKILKDSKNFNYKKAQKLVNELD